MAAKMKEKDEKRREEEEQEQEKGKGEGEGGVVEEEGGREGESACKNHDEHEQRREGGREGGRTRTFFSWKAACRTSRGSRGRRKPGQLAHELWR